MVYVKNMQLPVIEYYYYYWFKVLWSGEIKYSNKINGRDMSYGKDFHVYTICIFPKHCSWETLTTLS
jgi:hypothetical protein